MATFKELSESEKKVTRSGLNQLVDVIQEDVSGSTTRKTYQVFVTGGVGPGVTGCMFQTIFDQDFSLQTSNPIFDITYGAYSGSSDVASCSTGQDANGKVLFPSNSLQMREKVGIYSQFSQLLLGNASSQFAAPFSNFVATDAIDHAMFLCVKRLFARDAIKRETFAMRFYQSASHSPTSIPTGLSGYRKPNLSTTSASGSAIYTDVGSSNNQETSFGGPVGNIVDSSNTANSVGLLFYEQGIAVFDLAKIISGSQHVSGVIDAMNASSHAHYPAGTTPIGSSAVGKSSNTVAKFIPDLVQSGSQNDILDHISTTRFSSGTLTAMTFQNITKINSTIIFARATAGEFNYSSNPTYTDPSTGKIRVIETGQEGLQKAFTFITTVGLYDANDNLLAVAKLSRPVEKNNEKDLTIRVRLDF